MITVHCGSCNKAYQVPETSVGKMARCKHCGATFSIQSEASEPVTTADAAVTEPVAAAPAVTPAEAASDQPGALQALHPPAGSKRPFGMVFIVFYWVISGVLAVLGGLALTWGTRFLGAMNEGPREIFHSPQMTASAMLALAIMELVGVLAFLLGVMYMVASFGLWTYRKWGLQLSRVLAVVSVVLYALSFIATLYTRSGIVSSVAALVIAVGIMAFLFGRLKSIGSFQGFQRRGQSQGGEWEGFE
jgi:uncharacterized membrane protein (DUF2068 family)